LSGRSLCDVAAGVVRIEYRRDVLKAGLRFASVGVQSAIVPLPATARGYRPDS
jgi:hypothetical protein